MQSSRWLSQLSISTLRHLQIRTTPLINIPIVKINGRKETPQAGLKMFCYIKGYWKVLYHTERARSFFLNMFEVNDVNLIAANLP